LWLPLGESLFKPIRVNQRETSKQWVAGGTGVVELAIAAAILLAAWKVRYEWADKCGFYHRNRFTGVVCYRTTECWFASER
jgi:hypothetical protein